MQRAAHPDRFSLSAWIAALLASAALSWPHCLATSQAAQPWGRGESDIRLTEIHYHPPGDVAEEEFLELWNSGPFWVDLSGWRFVEGIEMTLPAGTFLGPDEYLVVARSRRALTGRVGAAQLVGDFEGRLSNGGEVLRLVNRTNRTIIHLHYRDGKGSDGGLWPERPDGEGPTLEALAPHSEWEDPWRWAASRNPGGSPGRARDAREERSPQSRLRLNEVATGGTPFVELWCRGSARVDLDGLTIATSYLPLADASAPRLALSGRIQGGKHRAWSGDEVVEIFAAKPSGVFLFAKDGRLLDALPFEGEAPRKAVSLGRVPDGADDFTWLSRASLGSANKQEKLADVVINEIFYHGPSESGDDEFVELHNPSKKRVSLAGWHLDDGIEFTFPADAEIPARGFVVVARKVSVIAARLRGTEKGLYGPFKGKLSDRGERIVLRDDWGREIDEVRYADRGSWPSDADGQGASLELRNPSVDNAYGAAWTRSGPGGSPLARNRNLQKLVPSEVVEVWHEPALPAPGDKVSVHVRVVGSREVTEVRVAYNALGSRGRPASKRLSDKGKTDDGDAGDGHFAGEFTLPSRLPRDVVFGYRLQVRSRGGRTVESPARGSDHLLAVVAKAERISGQPDYRIVLRPQDAERFAKQGRRASDWYPCSFLASVGGPGVRSDDIVIHGASVRLRGNNSRNPRDGRMSYRVKLPDDRLFDGRNRLILNAFNSFRQKAGGDFMRRCGVPAPRVRTVRLMIPGQNDARYLDVQAVDRNFLEERYGSGDGGLFRGFRGSPFGADLSYHGRGELETYKRVYRRETRKDREDMDDLLSLLEALDTKGDEEFLRAVEPVLDIDEWVTYLAANIVLGNTENGLARGVPDDFYLCQRPGDDRFVLVAWDHDSTFDNIERNLYARCLPAVRRLLSHPRIAPRYHQRVQELLDGPLSGAAWTQQAADMSRRFLPENLERLDRFVWQRQAFLRRLYTRLPNLAVSGAGSLDVGMSGSRVFAAARGPVAVSGRVDPGGVWSVRVAGRTAEYEPKDGTWKANVDLRLGHLPMWIECYDRDDELVRAQPVRLESSRRFETAPHVLRGTVEWTEEDGPYYLPGVLTIPSGSRLIIRPGTEILAGPATVIAVKGSIEARGSRERPIAFRSTSAERPWRGLMLTRTSSTGSDAANILEHCRFEGGRGQAADGGRRLRVRDAGGLAARRPFLHVVGSSLRVTSCLIRGIEGEAIGLVGGRVRVEQSVIRECQSGIVVDGGSVVLEGSRLSRLWGYGVRVVRGRGKVHLAGSTIAEAERAALSLTASVATAEASFLQSSGVGIELTASAELRASDLSVVSNGIGLLVDTTPWGADLPGKGSLVEISDSILAPNRREVSVGRKSRVELAEVTLLDPGNLADHVKTRALRTERPRFARPERGDFRPRSSAK